MCAGCVVWGRQGGTPAKWVNSYVLSGPKNAHISSFLRIDLPSIGLSASQGGNGNCFLFPSRWIPVLHPAVETSCLSISLGILSLRAERNGSLAKSGPLQVQEPYYHSDLRVRDKKFQLVSDHSFVHATSWTILTLLYKLSQDEVTCASLPSKDVLTLVIKDLPTLYHPQRLKMTHVS